MVPNGHPVVSSALPTIQLDRLRAGVGEESKRLLDACRTHGFFYLDLQSDPILCRQWEDMLAVMKNYFEQPLEVKLKDARNSDNYGYEPMGTENGPKPKTVDGYESLKISRREFLNGATDLTTPAVRDHTDLFFSFMQNAHNLSMVILKRLSSEMGLKGSDRFEAYHKEPGPSLSTLGFLRYPKLDDAASNNLGHNKHTDVGSLTVLLADKWGLQVLSPDTESWAFVEPRPKHAVINVGDSLRFPSRGELSSAVHRVIPRNGKQDEDRYSIAYFLRVNDDATFSDGNGKTWTGKEWHDYKFNAFKFDPKREPSVLEKVVTGMMEENDQLIRRAAKTEMVA